MTYTGSYLKPSNYFRDEIMQPTQTAPEAPEVVRDKLITASSIIAEIESALGVGISECSKNLTPPNVISDIKDSIDTINSRLRCILASVKEL